ncbi:MAG TPA: YdbL family protein [Salinisphaeraceae bacterium]|nr:YdbL family protein [Salinisphaeraceae bacterium]
MRLLRYLLFLLVLICSVQALALDLDAAKSQGLLGEQPNGYLGVVTSTPAAVELASEVNKKRRQAYERIAKKHGITVNKVERIAGKKAIAKTANGEYVKTLEGQWVKK